MGRSKGGNTTDGGGPGETRNDVIQMGDARAEPKKKKRDKKKKEKRKSKSDKQPKAPDSDEAAIGTEGPTPAISKTTASPSNKRKRDAAVEEIEIDVNAPEPPSKRVLRKLKKSGRAITTATPGLVLTTIPASDNATKANPKATTNKPESYPEHASQSRSKWGIWIGNLTFTASKPDLEKFFTTEPSPVARLDVTRINLPTNPQTGLNKGFAYVDFATEEALGHALSLSEKLWNGRRVLIKNAKDFSSRNPSTSAAAPALGANLDKNPPSRILFVGNLDFSTTEADLLEHFAFAGKISNVRLTTFEDTGKCKGFGFVDFEDEESVKRAMLGLSAEDQEKLKTTLQGKEELELERLKKKRGTIGSRKIKMEYGEDPSVRYKKRFGKDREDPDGSKGAPPPFPSHLMGSRGRLATGGAASRQKVNRNKTPDNRPSPRPTNSSSAYSDDIRRIGAIAQSSGKRVRFQL